MDDQTIIPTLFATNFKVFKKQYYSLQSLFSHFHIDIGDGSFVPITTSFLEDLDFLDEEDKTFEIHLMCYNPQNYIDIFKSFRNVTRIFIHYEAFNCYQGCFSALEEIKNTGFSTGVVINPETPFETIIPFAKYVDVLMFMSVHPGAQGQEFITNTYYKVKRAHDLNKNIGIQTDGGVKDTQIKQLVHYGATQYCVGSYLNEASNPQENLEILKQQEKKGVEEKNHITSS